MATPLVAPVQFDDRYDTRAIPTVTSNMTNTVVEGAQTLVNIDAQKQQSDLEGQLKDVEFAYRAAYGERQAQAAVVDEAGRPNVAGITLDKSGWSAGQRAEYNNLTRELDRTKSLVEQGKLTQQAFLNRAEALTKAAISRRPSLARELSSAASNALGINPIQGVRAIMEAEDAALKAKMEADKNSPESLVNKEIMTRAYNYSGGKQPSDEDIKRARYSVSEEQKGKDASVQLGMLKVEEGGEAYATGTAVKRYESQLAAGVNVAYANMPTTPEGLKSMIETGEFGNAVSRVRTTQTNLIENTYRRLFEQSPKTAEGFRVDAYAKLNAQLATLQQIGDKSIDTASAIDNLNEKRRQIALDMELQANYGDSFQRQILATAAGNQYSSNPVFAQKVNDRTQNLFNDNHPPAGSAGGPAKTSAPPSGAEVDNGVDSNVPVSFSNTDLSKDKAKGLRMASTLQGIIFNDRDIKAHTTASDKKAVGSELVAITGNTGAGAPIEKRPVFTAAIQATGDYLETPTAVAIPIAYGQDVRSGRVQGEVTKALALAAQPKNVSSIIAGGKQDRDSYKMMGNLGANLFNREFQGLGAQVYSGQRLVDLLDYKLVKEGSGSYVKVTLNEAKAKAAASGNTGLVNERALNIMRTQAGFAQGTINVLHNTQLIVGASLGFRNSNPGNSVIKHLQKLGVKGNFSE